MDASSQASPFRHDHVALVVRDLDVSREFYEFLGGRVVSRPSKAFMEIVLGEIRLHLLPAQANDDRREHRATRIDHLCLRLGSLDELSALCERLQPRTACAIEESPPLGDGGRQHVEERPPNKTLYFRDPDGIGLEVRAYA